MSILKMRSQILSHVFVLLDDTETGVRDDLQKLI